MTEKFKIADRVQINPENAKRYSSPWDKRVERGLFGVITHEGDWGWRIKLDMPKRAKYPHDWIWGSVRDKDMILVQRP